MNSGIRPDKIAEVGKPIREFLDGEDVAREEALRGCREIVRLAASAIQNIHRKNGARAEELLAESRTVLDRVKKALAPYPEIHHAGFLHAAEKELVEAVAFHAVIAEKRLPDPAAHGFDRVSYLHGLAESVGEIRRYLLDGLRGGMKTDTEFLLSVMDEIYFFLQSFIYTDAITRGLRKQVDYVRGVLERTRSDVTIAVLQTPRPPARSATAKRPSPRKGT